MKRLLLSVAAAMLVAAVVPLAASGNHSNGNGPKFEKANGTGVSSMYGEVHVNADDNGHGRDLGHFYIAPPPGGEIEGDVTCLRVDGNTAVVGGRQRGSNQPFIIEVRDNGEPGPGRDQHRWRMALPAEIGRDCPTINQFPNPSSTIGEGNYIVHDG